MAGTVHLSIEGHVAVLTNDNPDKHNAFDDDMDAQLFAAFGTIAERPRGPGRHVAGGGQAASRPGRDVGVDRHQHAPS